MTTLPIKLISTDFDGTLHAEHEDPPVPLDLQLLLGGLQARGCRWVINTGRDLSSLLEAVARADLGIQPDYVVAVEREIYGREGVHYAGVGSWNEQCRRQHAEVFDRVRPDLADLAAWVSDRHGAMVYEDPYSPLCVVARNNADMDAIQAHLESYCRRVGSLAVMRNDVYARFHHAGYTKGTALGEIARHLGVGAGETLAAGDHWNDLPMLSRQYAHFLVAPANAIPVVRDAVARQAGYVSHQPWGHGVARGLEHFLSASQAPGERGASA